MCGILMKILIIVAYFIPEIGSASHVYYDLGKAFINRGHDVEVITSYPREFNLNREDIGKNYPLDEVIDGIRIHRCKHISLRDNILLRGVEHFLLPLYYFLTYRRLKKKFDVCLIYMPPLPLYYFARLLKKVDGTPSVLNYQDFHPQELTDVGVLKNGLMIKLLEFIERCSYENADHIVVLSQGGIDYVLQRGGDPKRLTHIYNGGLIEDYKNYLSSSSFKETNGLQEKFLVTYAGILSPFQGVDNILDAAKELIEFGDILFYIVGDGIIKEHLELRIINEKISNVKLIPYQQRRVYFDIINSSDIAIISLDNRMQAPCLPGKIINLVALGKPIIALVPVNSECAKVVRKWNFGKIAQPNNAEGLKNIVLMLKDNKKRLNKLGLNGKKFFNSNMDLNRTILEFENVFESVITSRYK